MNTLATHSNRNSHNSSVAAVQAPVAASVARPQPRVRDFGIGYGRSSGYVQRPRYTSASATLFRIG